MPASILPRRIFWGRRDNAPANPLRGYASAAVLAGQIGGGAASGHLALQLLEAPACVAFAIVDHLDRGFPRHRAGDDRSGILADGLVDIVVAIVEADRPLETDRGHRAGTVLGVSVRLDRRRRRRGWAEGPRAFAPRPRLSRVRGGFPACRECWRWSPGHGRSGRFEPRFKPPDRVRSPESVSHFRPVHFPQCR